MIDGIIFLHFYDDKHSIVSMSIEQFRNDFTQRLESTGRSVTSVAHEFGVEQGSLSRFKNGSQGLSGDNVFALWPFVYGIFPITTATPAQTKQEVPNE